MDILIPVIPCLAHLVLAFAPAEDPQAAAPAEETEATAEPELQRAGSTPASPAEPAEQVVPPPFTPAPASAPAPDAHPVQPKEDEQPPIAREDWSSEPEPDSERTVLAGGTRRWFVAVHVGGTRPLKNAEYDGGALSDPGALEIEESFGAHLWDESSGASLGLALQQSFGLLANTYVFAPRFEYDAKLSKRYALYASPSLAAGYKLIDPGGLYGDEDSYCGSYDACEEADRVHQVSVQVGLGIKVIAGDRLLLSFRPVGLEVAGLHMGQASGDPGPDAPILAVRWHLSGGFGLTF